MPDLSNHYLQEMSAGGTSAALRFVEPGSNEGRKPLLHRSSQGQPGMGGLAREGLCRCPSKRPSSAQVVGVHYVSFSMDSTLAIDWYNTGTRSTLRNH